MNASQLLQRINRLPFEPFEIRTTDGEHVTVEHTSQIATSLNSASCAVYGPSGGPRIIDLAAIADIQSCAPAAVQPYRKEIGYIIPCWVFVLCMLPQMMYLTGITPTGPVPGVGFWQSIACATALAVVAFIWLRTRLRRSAFVSA